MPRFALKIEYDGTPFSGWQTQVGFPTVQDTLQSALAKLEPDVGKIAAAGRTDTGVHALGQVAHVDLTKDWDGFRLMEAANHHMRPSPVAIVKAVRVDDSFHARFSATERRYLFRVIARRAPPVLEFERVWHVRHPMDLELLRAGAAHLIGTHDFTTFRTVDCQALSPIKTLDRLDITEITRADATEFQFDVRARSFLHSQVRSLVGTLARVGSGRWHPDRIAEALAAKRRDACGPVAPPSGLYLAHVSYPERPFD